MQIEEIAKIIQQAGGTLYLVGGAIRDEFLGKESHDKDYCVTGITGETFFQLFPNSKIQGKDFPVFIMEQQQFALARKEKKIKKGHKGFQIETNETISIEEDLARRDVTINAMAKEVLTGKFIDPYQGKQDLEKGILRATTKAFKEDPLRVYRVARFAAQFGFSIEQQTLLWMKELKEELDTLPKERVFAEFQKALKTKQPSQFLEALKQAEILGVHFKEIEDLIGALQPEQYHPEGDAYQHTLLVLDKAAQLTKDERIRFSALVHDLGKGITPKERYPHHYGHDEKGVAVVEKLANRIGVPKIWTSCGKTAAKEHMKGGIFSRMTPAKKVQFIERVDKTKLGLEGLQIVVLADKTSTRNTPIEEINFAKIGKECLQTIRGNDIKKKYLLEEGKLLAEKLHQERVNWMKTKEEQRRNYSG